MTRYLDVVFGLPVEGAFSYLCEDSPGMEMGYRVMAPFGRRTLTGFVIGSKDSKPAGVAEIKPVQRIIDKRPFFDEKSVELAGWLSRMYLCSLGEALQAMLPSGRREVDIEGFDFERECPVRSYTLSSSQMKAIETIGRKEHPFYYLYGVTGSGKTEVFLNVARDVQAEGRGVIYLVPEISLTQQVKEVFVSAFKDRVAILHSGLTPSQRLKEWMRIFSGSASVAVGARSAVFAPFPSLGLIIMDEEHDGSYKSSNTPRYHARQVAMHRCLTEKAVFVSGSATPSLESYYHIKTKTICGLTLPERLSGGKTPKISVVDMKKEPGPLSKTVISRIREVHDEGRQTILFLNRRGFAYYFSCRSCGYEMKCRHCSVSLTFYQTKWLMVCHYCGYKTRPVDVCPACGSLDIGYSGFGTEKIEEEVAGLFPDYTVKRIDADSVRNKRKLLKMLNDFKEGRIDVLIGTQMVAKGLNFPRVKLVGIVLADTGLNLPDFRAAERAFGLVVQVAGRAGRVNPDGEVIIQTYRPDHEMFDLARGEKVFDFYDRELKVRKETGFPPYSRLIRFVSRSRDRKKAEKTCEDLASELSERINSMGEILGPADCPIAMIAGNHRVHLFLKTARFKQLHSVIRKVMGNFKTASGVYLEIDVDPVSLL
ncbi:MAG: primosomal protein N' [Spirochaetales bacterium]|nr:primosomal protein N' [Spirochaetales bacterium]